MTQNNSFLKFGKRLAVHRTCVLMFNYAFEDLRD